MGTSKHETATQEIAPTANAFGALVLVPQGSQVDVEAVYNDSIAMHHAVERAMIEGKLPTRTADAFTRSSLTKLQYCIELEKTRGCHIEECED